MVGKMGRAWVRQNTCDEYEQEQPQYRPDQAGTAASATHRQLLPTRIPGQAGASPMGVERGAIAENEERIRRLEALVAQKNEEANELRYS
jgi:hypothetical protein